MRILVNLLGVVLATAFILFLAVTMNELPLYIVCALGIGAMVVAFWRDELRPALAAGRENREA